jgi:hypothetical protein
MAGSATSPWYNTSIVNNDYLDLMAIRPIPALDSDPRYIIQEKYTHRPDLLAYDLYNDHRLWWVFAQRNMDVIKDPVYDMEAGIEIKLPQFDPLKNALGL